ncbi:MAG: zincin-like metallopeptidase domain-containing protein [Hyphomicrobiales bacterium]|nr:zincin-like metallopeptidase domain-containing protein [Hyphomicrobiales bacterium]
MHLDREMSGRFGSETYVMEERVAERGAAFPCSNLGIAQEPRADHASSVANWLAVLKSDKEASFTAASKASWAAFYLMGFTSSLQ